MAHSDLLDFSHATFAQALDERPGINVKSAKTNNGWVAWDDDSSNRYNQVVEYVYSDPASGKDLNYRSWYMETSFMKGGAGLVVSVKIDYERTTGDDHLILVCIFNTQANTELMQASIQFHGASQDNLIIAPINQSMSNGDMAQALHDQIVRQRGSVDYGGDTDNAGRKALADIAKFHVQAFEVATTVS